MIWNAKRWGVECRRGSSDYLDNYRRGFGFVDFCFADDNGFADKSDRGFEHCRRVHGLGCGAQARGGAGETRGRRG